MAENGDPTDKDDDGTEEPTRDVRRILRQQVERRRREAGDEAQERIGEEFQDYLDRSPVPAPFPVGQRPFATGREEPRPTGFDPRRLTRGARAAVLGDHMFNVKQVIVGGAPADDVTVVSSRRVEFVVPEDAKQGGENAILWDFGDPLAPVKGDLEPEVPDVRQVGDDYGKRSSK